MNNTNNDTLMVLSVKEMSNILRVSNSTMRNIITGKNHKYSPPPCFKIGEAWKCTNKDFHAWIRSLSVEEKMINKNKTKQK